MKQYVNKATDMKDSKQAFDQTNYHVELKGIGISLVDFKPKELAFISMRCLLIDFSTFSVQMGAVEKAFTDFSLSLRNFQIDDMNNTAYPVLLGPKRPFLNIERTFKKSESYKQHLKSLNDKERQTLGKPKNLGVDKPFLKIEFRQSSEIDGNLSTTTIESFEMDLVPLEIKMHVSFLVHLSDLVTALSSLQDVADGVTNSQILVKYNTLMEILGGQEPNEFDADNNMMLEDNENMSFDLERYDTAKKSDFNDKQGRNSSLEIS